MKKNIVVLLALILQIFFTSLLTAQSYFKPSIGDALRISVGGQILDARSLGMGNSNSVINDTYSATLLNPAALGLARKFTVNTSVGLNLYNNEAAFLQDTILGQRTETILSEAGMIIPLSNDTSDHNFVISLGYDKTKDFNSTLQFGGFNSNNTSLIEDLTSVNSYLTRDLLLSYPYYDPQTGDYLSDQTVIDNGNLYQSGDILENGSVNFWSFGIAYEFAHNIFFGASFNYNVGSYNRDGEFTETNSQGYYSDSLRTISGDPLTAGFQSFYINDIKDWVFNGYDLRFGVLYRFFNFVGIGVSVKTPTITSISEDHYFTGRSEFLTGNTVTVDTIISNKFTIQSPYEFTVAADVNIWFITATAEATYIDYTQMQYSGGLDVPQMSGLNKDIIGTYTQTINLKAGAELRLPFTGLSFRAGAMFIPYPVKDTPFEQDRKYLTAGAGITSGEGAIEFHLAGILGFWDEVSVNYGTSVSQVNQTIYSMNIMGSLTLRID
ncbi:MAG: hypothetical protein OQK56_01480 [Ignavibacteriaceae bacterium]|nr:hypothetical protein [Ignavibacteriaceae bacterium]